MSLGLGLGINKHRVSGGGAYTPAQDTDLFDYWDDQSGVTESGGELTAWVGSVNSVTASPPTVTSRPLYGTDTINSLDVLTFRNADPNYLQIDVSTLGTGCSMFFVINQSSTNAAHIGDTITNSSVLRATASASDYDNDGTFGGAIEVYSKNGLLGTNPTQQAVYDEVNVTDNIIGIKNISFNTLSSIYIGVRANLGIAFAGKIGDILISESSTRFDDNMTFLKTKYGY